jgi:hypothetical protein
MAIARRKAKKKVTKRRAEISIRDISKILRRIDKTSGVLELSARQLRFEAEKIQKRPRVLGDAAKNMEQAVRAAETTARVFRRVLEREMDAIEDRR